MTTKLALKFAILNALGLEKSDIKTALVVDRAQVSRTIDTLLKNDIIEKVDNRSKSLL